VATQQDVDEFNRLIRTGDPANWQKAGELATSFGFTPEDVLPYLNDPNIFPEFAGGVELETVQSFVPKDKGIATVLPDNQTSAQTTSTVLPDNQTSAPTETPAEYVINSLFREFLGRAPSPIELATYLTEYGSTVDANETNDWIRRSQQEILNRQSSPVNSLFEGGKQPSLEELRRVQNDPLTKALNLGDQYILAGQYPEAKALLDSTIATYGLNPTESYANMATYLNTNPKFEGVREAAGGALFTGKNVSEFGTPSSSGTTTTTVPAGGLYKRTPQEQAAYESQLASIPVNTAVPLPVMPVTTLRPSCGRCNKRLARPTRTPMLLLAVV